MYSEFSNQNTELEKLNTNFTIQDIPRIATQLIKLADAKKVLFYGEMGVGKTTLIKEIIKQLGVQDNVSSPTYSLINEYQSDQDELIYHFDFYRIEKEEEAYDMGAEEYFDSSNWCFIEWPERIKNLLPLNALSVSLKLMADGSRAIKTNNLNE